MVSVIEQRHMRNSPDLGNNEALRWCPAASIKIITGLRLPDTRWAGLGWAATEKKLN